MRGAGAALDYVCTGVAERAEDVLRSREIDRSNSANEFLRNALDVLEFQKTSKKTLEKYAAPGMH